VQCQRQHQRWRILIDMRSAPATALLTAMLLVVSSAAEHAWKNGTWVRHEGQTYVIETARDLITAEATGPGDSQLVVTVESGKAVQYAVEGKAVFIRLTSGDLRLSLVSSESKYSQNYGAIGAGHYIRSVAPGGVQVTLEDGSRWDMDPRQHFAVADWHPDDLIAVRRSTSDPDFAFEVDNTTQDDGAMANYRVR